MAKGLGGRQLSTLRLLLDNAGVLGVPGILEALFDKASPGAHSSLCRSLGALRRRGLIQTYGISVAGHATVIAALTVQGAKVAGGILWEGEEPGQP
jgi:hypothetical protein